MEKRVLGRGLDALIPKKSVSLMSNEYTYLPVTQIVSGVFQPRKEIRQNELEDLMNSIREKGIIQPIVVRKVSDQQFEVVAGGRRYQSAKLLGLKEIPVVIRDLSDQDTLIFAIVENLQRENLNPIDEAEAFKKLIDQFSFALDDIARFVGKDKTTVANALRLLKLPRKIIDAVRDGVISRSQARTILAVTDLKAQEELFNQIVIQKISVREVELSVQRIKKNKGKQDPFVKEVEDKLQQNLGTKVRVFNKKSNRGRIVIEYYSLDDLEKIVRRLS